MGITIGLLDVLVFHADAINSQKTVSAGVDLALGLLLLAVGALVATGRLHGRRKAPVPAGDGQPEKKGKKDGWAQRALAEPRLGLAMVVGALCGIPGAAYLSALHILVTGKSSTANQVVGVILFVLIEFLLIIIPFTFLELRPEATKAALSNAQDWLAGPRPPAHGLHRPDPGRLPGSQRPGTAELICQHRRRQRLRDGPGCAQSAGPAGASSSLRQTHLLDALPILLTPCWLRRWQA